jgi:hypothetical protein
MDKTADVLLQLGGKKKGLLADAKRAFMAKQRQVCACRYVLVVATFISSDFQNKTAIFKTATG